MVIFWLQERSWLCVCGFWPILAKGESGCCCVGLCSYCCCMVVSLVVKCVVLLVEEVDNSDVC